MRSSKALWLFRNVVCARSLMVYGAVLIVCSIAAPLGPFLWSALSTRNSAAGTNSTTGADSTPGVTSTELPREYIPRQTHTQTQVQSSHVAAAKPSGAIIAPSNATVKATVAQQATQSADEARARAEIFKLYHTWKAAWGTGDIDGIMKLYAPEVRFRDVGYQLLGYAQLRTWFEQLWHRSRYQVKDVSKPLLSIDGRRAVLLVGQSYGSGGRLRFTSRYVWKKQPVQRKDSTTQVADSKQVAAGKHVAADKAAPQWLIVEEAFLRFQGSSDLHDQIY
jgi:hypothetical protein